MPSPLASKTIADIETALAEEKTTAITEIIQIIQQLASKAFSISIEELSQLVGRDPTVTAKVISTANTLGFNPTATPILTISEAIHTVGFEKIRNLAISLMLAENAGQRENAYEQRQAAALCVCSGMLAEKLRHQPNSELIFVCASLRSYGQLLLSSFMARRYRLARSLALNQTEEEAFTEVFGLTPLALARAILTKTNLPKTIMHSLRNATDETLSQPPKTEDDQILVLSELATQLCSIAFDYAIAAEDFNQELAAVLERFSPSHPVDLEAVYDALGQVNSDLGILNRAVGISEQNSPGSLKLQARLEGEELPEPPPTARIYPPEPQKGIAEMDETERAAYTELLFSHVEANIAKYLHSGAKVKLTDLFHTLCEVLCEAAELESSLIFEPEEYHAQRLSAHYGSGPLFAKIKNRPLVATDKNDIFSLSLQRKEDILIENTQTGNIQKILPEWIHAAGPFESFIILPVNYQETLAALIVGTAPKGRRIRLTHADLKHLRAIRAQLSELYSMIDAGSVTAQ